MTVTIEGPLATYHGRIEGYDPVVGPNGATVVFVTELVEVTDTVPTWAIHPDDKVGRQTRFSPRCIQ
jgi:hypothetical protein